MDESLNNGKENNFESFALSRHRRIGSPDEQDLYKPAVDIRRIRRVLLQCGALARLSLRVKDPDKRANRFHEMLHKLSIGRTTRARLASILRECLEQ
jgi:hypothetical protein